MQQHLSLNITFLSTLLQQHARNAELQHPAASFICLSCSCISAFSCINHRQNYTQKNKKQKKTTFFFPNNNTKDKMCLCVESRKWPPDPPQLSLTPQPGRISHLLTPAKVLNGIQSGAEDAWGSRRSLPCGTRRSSSHETHSWTGAPGCRYTVCQTSHCWRRRKSKLFLLRCQHTGSYISDPSASHKTHSV